MNVEEKWILYSCFDLCIIVQLKIEQYFFFNSINTYELFPSKRT